MRNHRLIDATSVPTPNSIKRDQTGNVVPLFPSFLFHFRPLFILHKNHRFFPFFLPFLPFVPFAPLPPARFIFTLSQKFMKIHKNSTSSLTLSTFYHPNFIFISQLFHPIIVESLHQSRAPVTAQISTNSIASIKYSTSLVKLTKITVNYSISMLATGKISS